MKLITLFILLILASCQVKKAQETGVLEGHVPSAYKFTVTTPLNISYTPGSTIPFTLTFPKVVTVTGTPQLIITVGSTNRTVDYVSGSGSAVLVFNYTVQAGENDVNGIALATSINPNGGTLIYETDKNCSTTITSPNLASVLVDSTAPTITLVTPPSNGTYISGGVLNFSFQFSEAVTVTGTPRVPIILTSGTVYANYVSGSGTTTLLFRYTATVSDEDTDGISMQPLDLNGGTIVDVVSYNANLTYTPPGTTAVLVAGNTPSITSITPPANGRYLTSQNLDFTINFDQIVIVTLTPRLAIALPTGTVYATYVSGGGTSSLVFRYNIAPGEYDSNGISLVSPLEPNGGAIQNVTMTTNALLTFSPPNTASINVDGLDPLISSVTPPPNGWYVLANNLNFTVNYTSPVVVTGTPKLSMTVGGTSVEASYLSGSGTTALIFRYTVAAGNLDIDGIATSSPLVLSGGTIQDIFGDSAGLTFTAPNTAGVLVDAISPSISLVSAPANATYYNGQNVDFTVVFSENAIVSGVPSISLTVGATSKTAVYTSGSGTNTWTFRYVVGIGDMDANGIANASPIALNAGTIQDAAGNNLASLTFIPPVTTGVLVDGTVASISSITPPANATYQTSGDVDFVANFTRNVVVTGVPQIEMTIGSSTVYATYISGSGTSALTFRYTVAAGDKDLNGLDLVSPLQLNGGTIQDSTPNNAVLTFTPPDTTGILIDGIDLTISSVTPPSDSTYLYNQNMDFVVNYNYVAVVTGSPRIQLTVGAATLYATYLSGSGSTALTFRYTVGSADVDADGVTTVGPNLDLNAGTIKDEFNDNAALAFTALNYPNKKVEGIVPLISSVTGPADSTYGEAEDLDFIVTTSEAVNIIGSPRLTLTVGATTRYATYLSGSGSASLTFRYTVPNGDMDANGIVVSSPLDLNSGTIKDIPGNDLGSLTFTPPNMTGVLVNGTAPFITSVTAPGNSTYVTTNNIDFIVNYSQAVDVTGNPQLALNIGGSSVQATYLSGSGSTALTFRYTVVAGNNDIDGIASSSPLTLNGGTIKNGALSNASLSFTPPSTTGVLVDGIDIVISSITPPADATYKIGDNLDFTVNYNYAATVTGVPRIQLTVGAATLYASYVSGSGTSGHLFRYTVAASDVDTDGITTVSPIDLNSGTIKDAFGDNATLTFSGSNYPNKKVDGIRPTFSSMVASGNASYIIGEDINFTATYSEAVTISGSPRLTLTVGVTTRYATYSSGSGSNTIVFKYTVLAGDEDTDGIAAASVLDLAGGSITDAPGNAQTALGFTPPTLTGVMVDGVVPTVTSITPPASQTYGNSANLDFTVNFSEAVTITGSPTLTLNIGGASVSATYLSGSPSSAIVFRYTTVTNDEDTDGVASVTPLALAGGTIKDAALNSADLAFSGGIYSGVLVDAVPPSISSVTLPADNTYQNAGARPTLTFTVNYSENVNVVGTPRIHLTIGATTRYATYVSGTGTAALVFSYNVAAADLDLDGIAVINSNNIDLNGATMRDAVLNNALVAMGSLVTNKIFAVIPSMRNWYDLSDTTKITTAGSDITAINDKIGTYNFSGAVPYAATGFNGGSNAFATCATTDYFTGAGNHTTPTAMIAVFRAPSTASTSQYLLFQTSNTRPMVQFNSTAGSGTVTYGVTGAKYTSAWSGNAATQTTMWATNGYYVRGFSWSGTQNRTPNLCRMDGQIAEVFFFSAQPTVAQMDAIEVFINARYGLSFP